MFILLIFWKKTSVKLRKLLHLIFWNGISPISFEFFVFICTLFLIAKYLNEKIKAKHGIVVWNVFHNFRLHAFHAFWFWECFHSAPHFQLNIFFDHKLIPWITISNSLELTTFHTKNENNEKGTLIITINSLCWRNLFLLTDFDQEWNGAFNNFVKFLFIVQWNALSDSVAGSHFTFFVLNYYY